MSLLCPMGSQGQTNKHSLMMDFDNICNDPLPTTLMALKSIYQVIKVHDMKLEQSYAKIAF